MQVGGLLWARFLAEKEFKENKIHILDTDGEWFTIKYEMEIQNQFDEWRKEYNGMKNKYGDRLVWVRVDVALHLYLNACDLVQSSIWESFDIGWIKVCS